MKLKIALSLPLFIGLFIASFIVINQSSGEQADATTCFGSSANRQTSFQNAAFFPRGGIARYTNGCAQSDNFLTNWALIASYYRIGSGGTGLHTPDAAFYMFTYSPTAANQTLQNIRIYNYGQRCSDNFGPVRVQYNGATITTLSNTTSNNANANVSQDRSFNVGINDWEQLPEYGGEVWRTRHPIVFQAPVNGGSRYNCKVKIASLDGHILSFAEDDNAELGYTENNQRFNQNNWTTNKRHLGPFFTGGRGRVGSIYHSPSQSTEVEYSIPFAPDCTVTSSRFIHLRVYDADYPFAQEGNQTNSPASNGPFQSASFGVPSFRIYDESTGQPVTVRRANNTVIGSTVEVYLASDEYIEYRVQIQPNREYSWVWYNIQANNGIQVWMPFSEIFTHPNFDCIPINTTAGSCTVNGLLAKYTPGQTLSGLSFDVENGTNWDWDNAWALGASNDANEVTSNTLAPHNGPMRIRIPPGTTVPQGSSYTFNATDANAAEYRNAPNTVGDFEFIYRMHGGGPPNPYWLHDQVPTRQGPECRFTIRVEAPVVTAQPPICTIRFDGSATRYEVGTQYQINASVENPNTGSITLTNLTFRRTGGALTSPLSGGFNGIPAGIIGGATVTNRLSTQIRSIDPGRTDFEVEFSASGGGTNWTGTCQSAANAATDIITVESALHPYVRHYGGDIYAGGGIETPNNVCVSPDADIFTRLRGNNYLNYRGSGVELAAFAAGQIRALQPASQQQVTPLTLSFANTLAASADAQVNTFNRDFGGGFSQQCARDNFAYINYSQLTQAPNGNIQSLTSGSYRLDGNAVQSITTGTGGIPYGERIVLYREGDVYINDTANSGRFGYEGSDWQDRSQIPSFTLVVRGNIYIDATIRQLDGVYIAQPTTDNAGNTVGGEIFTCATNAGAGRDLTNPVNSAALFNSCRNQLVIYGAFQAQRVHLLRTVETASSATPREPFTATGAGEVFIYPPELFLTQGGGLPSSSGAYNLQSLIALPPVF